MSTHNTFNDCAGKMGISEYKEMQSEKEKHVGIV